MNTNRVATTVRHLVPGDVLIGSGQTVLDYPYMQTRTPGSKRYVYVEQADGLRVTRVWNASTTMTVLRTEV
jgi:hypothetical protein